jgi:hypothetical protein
MMEEQFIDLYDFLGIPPVSPPNLIYLAILKIESIDFQQHKTAGKDDLLADILYHLAVARERLLNTAANRQAYEQEWGSYYFPTNGEQTDIEKLCERNALSRLLGGRLRLKSTVTNEIQENIDDFDYANDFRYFMMRDLPTARDVFFLNPQNQIQLSPLQDTIFFEDKQFYLQSHGKLPVEVGNDAIGKVVIVKEKVAKLPLHIGDRIEFANGARLILRNVYAAHKPTEEGSIPFSPAKNSLALHFLREQIVLPLDTRKIYILGRNTSDIHNLSFDEELFCFVNIGRRERSISRQNLQIFCHRGNWYIQDLGSRYGTTLDFADHFRFETLVGGSIMPLERGYIRLGYDKSYLIEVDSYEKLDKKRHMNHTCKTEPPNGPSIYDIPLL